MARRLVAMIVLAYLTHRLIEAPAQRLGKRLTRPVRVAERSQPQIF